MECRVFHDYNHLGIAIVFHENHSFIHTLFFISVFVILSSVSACMCERSKINYCIAVYY